MGTMCGGTMYLADCLQSAGLACKHERPGADGLMCGHWVLNRYNNRMQPLEATYGLLGVVVRHPLLVAETLPRFMKGARWPAWWTGDQQVDALRYWVETFEEAERVLRVAYYDVTCRIRIDSHFQEDYSHMAQLLNISPSPAPRRKPQSKPKRWPKRSWAWWEQEDGAYAMRGQELVATYGLEEVV